MVLPKSTAFSRRMNAHSKRTRRISFALLPLALLVCNLAIATPCIAQELPIPLGSQTTERPHIVLYLLDQFPADSLDTQSPGLNASSNQRQSELMPAYADLGTRGLTFSHVYSASPDPKSSHQIFYRGVFPRWDQTLGRLSSTPLSPSTASSDTRSLTSHLKSLGYRLLQIGESPVVHGQHFAPEPLLSLEQWHTMTQAGANPDLGFTQFLTDSLRDEGRPVCLLIHDKLSSDERSTSIARDANALDNRIGIAASAANKAFGENQTLFVLTAFCGSGLVEENERLKDEVLQVPLIVVWPEKVTPNNQSDAMISTVDFLPTLIELVGGTPPGTGDGFSFAGIVRGEEIDHRDVIFAVDPQSNGHAFCIRDRRFKLVQAWKANPSDTGQTDSDEEMYDLNADPDERRNLQDVSTYQGRRQEYRSQLLTWLYRLGIRLRR